jgi:hypothetical protein
MVGQSANREGYEMSFADDLIIASDDGKLYKISQDQLQQYRVMLFENDPSYAKVVNLLKAGVQVAAVPITKDEGGASARGDMMCYLLNLAGLKTKTSWEDD